MNTGAPPFEEWAEEWLHDAEVESSSSLEPDCGEDLIWCTLALWCKRLSLMIRRGEKEIFRYAVVLYSINVVLIIGIKNPHNRMSHSLKH